MNSNQNQVQGLIKMGGSPISSLQTFLSMIILGYFGVKIVYGGFFHFYPDKYYYRNVDIDTSETGDGTPVTKKIAINSFMPGIWNNEMTDFVSLMILVCIIFVFTNVPARKMFGQAGFVSPMLLVGFLLGLLFPVFYQNIKKQCSINQLDECGQLNMSILIISIFIILGLFFIQSNYQTQMKSSYYIYVTAILFIIIALYYTRKMSQSYVQVKYYQTEQDQCKNKENGFVFTSGDQLLITPAFAAWILLFFFTVEPSDPSIRNIIYFIYGILLGIFTSSMSYYGIDYFLIKTGQKTCSSDGDCTLRDMPKPPANTQSTYNRGECSGCLDDETDVANLLTVGMDDVWSRMMNLKTILIFVIILIVVYLFYFSMSNRK